MKRAAAAAIALLLLVCAAGCGSNLPVSRNGLLDELPKICGKRFQASVTCAESGDTLWVYLPYTPGRGGLAGTRRGDKSLMVEYRAASLNPYRVVDPPELKYLVQKMLGEIRALQLRCSKPYTFFVLVVTDIADSKNKTDQWYIAYFDDLKRFKVGVDFSGEGYNRLTWSQEAIPAPEAGSEGGSPSYQDTTGKHLKYHDLTLEEFAEKQIAWRIYKRFTIEYNTVPFDVSSGEKKDAVIKIVKAVLEAYNLKSFDTIYLKDSSAGESGQEFLGYSREDIEKYPAGGIVRKPAF